MRRTIYRQPLKAGIIIMSNKEKFQSIVNAYIKRDGIIPLMNWLESTDFYTAPASTRFHLSCEEGLLCHSLNVYYRLLQQYQALYGTITAEAHETLAIIGLYHDLCKADTYRKEWKNVKVYCDHGSRTDAGGKYEWEVKQGYAFNEKLAFGYHGPKSAYLIGKFLKLTDEEHISIANHMGFSDRFPTDYALGKVYEQCNLAYLLHVADCLATFIDERGL